MVSGVFSVVNNLGSYTFQDPPYYSYSVQDEYWQVLLFIIVSGRIVTQLTKKKGSALKTLPQKTISMDLALALGGCLEGGWLSL